MSTNPLIRLARFLFFAVAIRNHNGCRFGFVNFWQHQLLSNVQSGHQQYPQSKYANQPTTDG